jgi:hypothetical protein
MRRLLDEGSGALRLAEQVFEVRVEGVRRWSPPSGRVAVSRMYPRLSIARAKRLPRSATWFSRKHRADDVGARLPGEHPGVVEVDIDNQPMSVRVHRDADRVALGEEHLEG